MGTHFLSNFITPNNPYVPSIPDPRLAKVGSSILTLKLGITNTEIQIELPDFLTKRKTILLKLWCRGRN